MNQQQRRAIFDRLAIAIPDPTTELHYNSPFELLIAVVLSAQATDKGVNKATAKLFPVANTPEAVLALGENGLKDFIKTIGLFNSKAKHIISLCQQLLTLHAGQVPNTRNELEAIAVDTHIFRVANRTGLAKGKNVLEVERGLMKCVPKRHQQDAHHLLILHGRYTCTARKPKCQGCVLADLCEFNKAF
ncbi:MAG: endonuclease III [Methylococcaceae bacterium]|nr:endonuclease III [Methylococcaceae bacterium]